MSIRPTTHIWFNGRLIPWNDATVHVMTYALHMGASVFEGIRCYETPGGPAFFRLDAHLRRLLQSAAIYDTPVPFDEAELASACHEVIRANALRSAYVRPLVWLGMGGLGTDPTGNPVEAMVAAVEWSTYHGEGALQAGVDVGVSSWRRPARSTIPTMAKAGGVYLSSQLIALEARRNGYAEGIALDTDGNLSEGSAENLFLARDGVLFTPPRSASILAGITRDSVMTLARDMGIEVREEALPREALYTADEIFFTGTAAEVTPVRSVDRKRVGDGSRGPITASIQRAFFGLFDGTTRDAWGWLEPVAPDSGESPPPTAAVPLPASTPPEAAEMREDIVTNLFEIIDSRRWDELGACFHPEVVYQRPGYEPIVGVDRLLHFYRHERVIASGEHRLEAVVAQDGHMACWGRFVGVGRDGTPIDEAFADTYVLSDGRISARKSFFYRPAI